MNNNMMFRKSPDAVARRSYAKKKYEKFYSIHRKIVAINYFYSEVAALILNIVFSTGFTRKVILIDS